MNKQKVLICGLPSSGKTTFLAALWHLISLEEIPTALTLRSLPKNREYLNSLSKNWCRFIQFDRTLTDELQEISLQLKDNTTEIDLNVPDMSGEIWLEDVWKNRSFTDKTAEWAQGDSGVMLFLHADKIRPPIDIMNYNAMVEATGKTPVDGELSAWSAKNSPTQVVLVDILQTLVMPPIGNKGRRLVVVISAWDKAEDKGETPDSFLRVELPLLHQFLRYSGCYSDIKIFGVSALGGDLESPEDAERLKSEDVPSKRIRVVSDNYTQHDLTVPIHWLISK